MRGRIIKAGEYYKAQILEMRYFQGKYTGAEQTWRTLHDLNVKDILCKTEREAEALLRDYASRHKDDKVVKEIEL